MKPVEHAWPVEESPSEPPRQQPGASADAGYGAYPDEDGDDIGTRVADACIRELFSTGLRLQAVLPLTPDPVQARLREAVEGIDRTIGEIRILVLASWVQRG